MEVKKSNIATITMLWIFASLQLWGYLLIKLVFSLLGVFHPLVSIVSYVFISILMILYIKQLSSSIGITDSGKPDNTDNTDSPKQ